MNQSYKQLMDTKFLQNLQNVRQNQSLLADRNKHKHTSFSLQPGFRPINPQPVDFDGHAVAEQDPMFPNIRLVKRYLSPEATAQCIPPDTDLMTITELYKQVSPPDFKRPSTASANFVVLGIVATRSESRTSAHGNQYVVMTLSDLKYDISLALHGKAREKYWKIRPGTLIAIFNPKFYVQKSENVARNLALSCSIDCCILEIGQAKDLGQCDATTSASNNSKRCKNWVDVRKSHVCEFHVEQMLLKSKRPEFNAASAKLWDPQSSADPNSKRLTVVRGGEVSWKRGLQVDTQFKKTTPYSKPYNGPDARSGNNQSNYYGALKREFPDAQIGNIYQSEKSSLSMDLHKYEESLASKQKRLHREKRQLERITDDAKLNEKLVASATYDCKSKNSDKTEDFWKMRGEATRTKLRKLGILPALSKRSKHAHGSNDDIDDELIIY